MKTLKTLILLLATTFFINGNLFAQWKKISGKGPVVKQELKLDKFNGLGLAISADVYLRQGPQKVVIEAQQNIIDLIEKEVDQKNWIIEFPKGVSVKTYNDPIKIYVSMPYITDLAVSGSGDIVGETSFKKLDNFRIAVSGSGDIQLDIEAQSVNMAISGSGDIELSGRTENQKIGISGSGDIDTYDLQSHDCTISIAGSGDCKVNVKDNLKVAIAGSGGVRYQGDPNVKSNIAGSGDVTKSH